MSATLPMSQETANGATNLYLVFGLASVAFSMVWGMSVGGMASQSALGTAAAGLLLCLTAVTTFTDLKSRRIPNWATYTTFVLALMLNALAMASSAPAWLGAIGMSASLIGGLGLFFVMLIVFSITGGGAGDVKFAGCLGALFGFRVGLESLLCGYVAAAAVMAAIALVRIGPMEVVQALGRSVGSRLLPTRIAPPKRDQKRWLMTPVPLGPFFAAGALISLHRESVGLPGVFF